MGYKIWVHAEALDGKLNNVTFELLSKAHELSESMKSMGGATVEATLIGNGLLEAASLLAGHGASAVYTADDPKLRMYSPLTYVPILTELVMSHKPDIYLFGATAIGSALGPAVAARLKTGMAAHCVDILIDEKKQLKALVPSFGGKIMGEILCPERRPQMASVKPGVFLQKPAQAVPLKIYPADPSIWKHGDNEERLTPVKIVRQPPHGIPLNEADVVVCGGFGVGDTKNWEKLEALAGYLGGAIACTRPAVDEGWIEESAMVGTSGQNIRPKVYIGFGISGAAHHVCGMNNAGVVINVNIDKDASVFDVSDFCAVADVKTILPALIEAVKPK